LKRNINDSAENTNLQSKNGTQRDLTARSLTESEKVKKKESDEKAAAEAAEKA